MNTTNATKCCISCKAVKPTTDFSKCTNHKDGLSYYCKDCIRERSKRYYERNRKLLSIKHKIWRSKNKIHLAEKSKSYFTKNRQRLNAYQRKYQNENRDKINKRQRQYVKRNLARIRGGQREYMRNRLRTDITFRIKSYLRSRIYGALKHNKKSNHTNELLGCNISNLRKHLERKFQNGMTWENYGKWHIDHIMPCASFNLADPDEQRRCFHYTNLQPLWAVENLSKGCKLL